MSDFIKIEEVEKILEGTFKCEFCDKILSSKSSLKMHQKTAKYCLEKQGKVADIMFACDSCGKKFTLKDSYNKHVEICLNDLDSRKIKEIISENEELKIKYENQVQKNKKIIIKHKREIRKIKEKFDSDFKEREVKYEEHIKDLENKLENIALKASVKPTTTNKNKINNTINNFQPISFEEIKAKSSEFTMDLFKKGIEGYYEFCVPFIRGKYLCVDIQRGVLKWKNEDGAVITDYGGTIFSKKFFQALQDQNQSLLTQYINEMQESVDLAYDEGRESDAFVMTEYYQKFALLAMQVKDAARGKKTELASELTKKISTNFFDNI